MPVSAIATSTGQNDSGMFELALKDERFLPFEGAGVVSRWSIELLEDESLRAFDYDSIADVVLHVRYTSREEGGAFKAASVVNLRNQLVAAQSRLEMKRVFRVSSDFASSWTAFRNPAPGAVRRNSRSIWIGAGWWRGAGDQAARRPDHGRVPCQRARL